MASYVDPKAWRREALAYSLKLLEQGGQEYAFHAADKAERESEGLLSGLGARVRQEAEKRRAAATAGAK